MKEAIEKVLAEVAAKYNDRRLHVCNLRADVDEQGAVKIAGRVLETSYVDAVRRALPPGVHVAGYDVRVLRERTTKATVAANLTDLHLEPSFLSELLTQVMHGTELEILEEKEKWCLVRQRDGYLGWAYRAYLTDAPAVETTHIVIAPVANVMGDADAKGKLISRLLGGTLVRAQADGPWARVEFAGGLIPAGFVQTTHLRSLAPSPTANARQQIVADAREFTGVYYLWGGGSAWGIDCSGLAQLAHRLSGITIPRDADMQFAAGEVVEPPFAPGDLLFFGEKNGHRKITHVGISTGGWGMIHSSRSHNGVYEDNVQAVEHLRDSFVGGRAFVAR